MRKKLTAQERSEVARRASARPKDRLWKKHPTGICGIPGCGAKHYMKDLCELHYKRWKRTGSVGGLGRQARQPKKTLEGHQPLIARPMQHPTKRLQKMVEDKGRSFVQKERDRRIKRLVACVDSHGERIPYITDAQRGRIVYRKGSAEVLVEGETCELLAKAGLVFDNGAGVLVLTESGKETVSEWGVVGLGDASARVEFPGQPESGEALPGDHDEDGREMPEAR